MSCSSSDKKLSGKYLVPTDFLEKAKQMGINYECEKQKNLYELLRNQTKNELAAQEAKNGKFLNDLREKIVAWDTEFHDSNKCGLITSSGGKILNTRQDSFLTISLKSYESCVNKSYREYADQESEYYNKYTQPHEWMSVFDDIFRTRIVCKYIDGLDFLSNKIIEFCQENSKTCTVKKISKDRGYYAYHVYVDLKRQIVKEADIIDLEFKVEIQIITQLQETLYDLTHKSYERLRVNIDLYEKDWKWNHDDIKFKIAYVSHALQLMESLILNIRNLENKEI